MSKPIVIGSRGSDLALWQANSVKAGLAELFPEHTFELKTITTTGDEIVDVAGAQVDLGLGHARLAGRDLDHLEQLDDLRVRAGVAGGDASHDQVRAH